MSNYKVNGKKLSFLQNKMIKMKINNKMILFLKNNKKLKNNQKMMLRIYYYNCGI